MTSVYPLDKTGVAPSNLVTNEQQTISAVNYKDFSFLIPQFAPIYATSLKISYKDINGNTRPMVEGVDYLLGLPFIGATRALARPVYGSVVFLDLTLNGTIIFEKYQTLGGNYVLDTATLTALMVNMIYNPRVTSWEQVTNLPENFPPSPHQWDLIDMVGMSGVDSSLRGIADAIVRSINNGQNDHFTDFENPHETDKGQIGLDMVENYPPATLSQAIAGTSFTAYMTPGVAAGALSTSLVPVNNNIASLSVRVDGLAVRMSTAETNITGLRTDLTSLSVSTSTKVVSLSTLLSTTVVNMNTADALLQSGVTSLSTSLAGTNTSLASLSTLVNTRDTSLSTAISNLQTQRNTDVTNLNNADNNLQTQITNVLNQVNNQYSSIQGQIGSLQGQITSVNNYADNINNARQAAEASLSTFVALGNLIPAIFNNVPCNVWQAAANRCQPAGTGGTTTGPVGGF